MNLSISDLFIGGLLPGVMMIVAMQFVCWLICHLNGWGHLISIDLRRIVKTAIGAWIGFGAILLVIWGIYSGKFSPTEAAGVTAGFCTIVGLIFYPIYRYVHRNKVATREQIEQEEAAVLSGADRAGLGNLAAEQYSDSTGYLERVVIPGFSFRELPDLIMRSGQITGVLAPLIAISVVMQQILTLLGAKEFFTVFVGGMGGYYAVLFVCMGIVLLAGTILESLPNTIIFAPILAPIAAQFGIDPIHFAVVFLIGDAIGFITPPYGLNLYVAQRHHGHPLLPPVVLHRALFHRPVARVAGGGAGAGYLHRSTCSRRRGNISKIAPPVAGSPSDDAQPPDGGAPPAGSRDLLVIQALLDAGEPPYADGDQRPAQSSESDHPPDLPTPARRGMACQGPGRETPAPRPEPRGLYGPSGGFLHGICMPGSRSCAAFRKRSERPATSQFPSAKAWSISTGSKRAGRCAFICRSAGPYRSTARQAESST